jgi:hypothetical protein
VVLAVHTTVATNDRVFIVFLVLTIVVLLTLVVAGDDP